MSYLTTIKIIIKDSPFFSRVYVRVGIIENMFIYLYMYKYIYMFIYLYRQICLISHVEFKRNKTNSCKKEIRLVVTRGRRYEEGR